jgi:hypothetical protein
VRALVSVTERDLPAVRLEVTPDSRLLIPFACALQAAGLRVSECRPATRDDIVALGSSWAKRLGIPARRPAWVLTADKP